MTVDATGARILGTSSCCYGGFYIGTGILGFLKDPTMYATASNIVSLIHCCYGSIWFFFGLHVLTDSSTMWYWFAYMLFGVCIYLESKWRNNQTPSSEESNPNNLTVE
jgi:hypothetical protein